MNYIYFSLNVLKREMYQFYKTESIFFTYVSVITDLSFVWKYFQNNSEFGQTCGYVYQSYSYKSLCLECIFQPTLQNSCWYKETVAVIKINLASLAM